MSEYIDIDREIDDNYKEYSPLLGSDPPGPNLQSGSGSDLTHTISHLSKTEFINHSWLCQSVLKRCKKYYIYREY